MHVDYRQPSVPVRSRSAHDVVAQGIGRGILEGEFPIGSILPRDAELMERYSVSRTSLREALKTLAAKGLIEAKTKVGTTVLGRKTGWNMFDPDILAWQIGLGVDRQFLASLFEIRQALEPRLLPPPHATARRASSAASPKLGRRCAMKAVHGTGSPRRT